MDAVKTLAAVVISGGLLVGAAPAYAITATAQGVSATASGAKITLTDTSSDGKSVKAEWYRYGSSSKIDITNNSGSGSTTKYTTGGTVYKLQACRIIVAGPDNCSGWRY